MPLGGFAGSADAAAPCVLDVLLGLESFEDRFSTFVSFSSLILIVGASFLISNLLGVAHRVLLIFFLRKGLKLGAAWLKVNIAAYFDDYGSTEGNGLPGGVDLINVAVCWTVLVGYPPDLSLFWNFLGLELETN